MVYENLLDVLLILSDLFTNKRERAINERAGQKTREKQIKRVKGRREKKNIKKQGELLKIEDSQVLDSTDLTKADKKKSRIQSENEYNKTSLTQHCTKLKVLSLKRRGRYNGILKSEA